MNDSTAQGYLAPLSPPPAYDIDLDKLIQPAVVGITGLPDALVVIKGQPIPPQQPGRTVTWCAVGVMGIEAAVYEDETHIGCADHGLGQSRYFRPEEIDVLASFYGPSCRAAASRLRDGLAVAQNRDPLESAGLKFVRCDPIVGLADFTNNQYIRRADLPIRLRRMVGRSYAIRNVASLAGAVGSFDGPHPLITNLDPP